MSTPDSSHLAHTARASRARRVIGLVAGCVALVGAVVVGTGGGVASAAPTTRLAPPTHAYGYRMVASDGGVFNFGAARYYGSMGAVRLNKPVVGLADVAGDTGYWEVASDGGIFAFGSAQFHGSMGAVHLNKPVIGMLASPDGGGYLLFASDGGIFAFGDAAFHGSLGGSALTSPVVGVASTPTGGYWILQQNGTVTPFGDATIPPGASMGNSLGAPAVSIASTPDGGGYWITTINGSVSAYGDASTWGANGGAASGWITGGVGTPDGLGYWTTDYRGGVAAYGDAAFLGSMSGAALAKPVVAISALAPPAPIHATYAATSPQPAEIFPSPTPQSPVVVLIHGGGFSGGSVADPLVYGEATYLQASGVTVVVPSYDLAGNGVRAFPMEVTDVVAAVHFAEGATPSYNGNPGVNGSNITLMGGSAGGTLVALAGEQVPVKAVIDLSGIADFPSYFTWLMNGGTWLWPTIRDALGCGGVGGCSQAQLISWSPADQHIPASTRWLIGGATGDPLVPISQDAAMSTAVTQSGHSSTFDQVGGGYHAFELCPWLNADALALIRS